MTEGTALAMSGAGYPAMLFQVGVLWRLNEAGILTRLDRIASVSAGSIVAALLGREWDQLEFDADGVAHAFSERVVAPLQTLAATTIDFRAVVRSLVTPASAGDLLVRALRRELFGDASLQDFPDVPLIIINASNTASGAILRFSKPYLADYRIGVVAEPHLPLAVAVGASCAAPYLLGPVNIDMRDQVWDQSGTLAGEYRAGLALVDRAVQDILALESVWKVVVPSLWSTRRVPRDQIPTRPGTACGPLAVHFPTSTPNCDRCESGK